MRCVLVVLIPIAVKDLQSNLHVTFQDDDELPVEKTHITNTDTSQEIVVEEVVNDRPVEHGAVDVCVFYQ